MDLDSAVAAHAEWKIKLRTAIDRGETLDVRVVSADNCCELGRWLSADAKRLMGASPTLPDCAAKHTAFHREAGKVAQAINARQMDQARAMLAAGAAYADASSAVGVALMRLKREVAAR
jgi:methyl-accepting chemotaxis protein